MHFNLFSFFFFQVLQFSSMQVLCLPLCQISAEFTQFLSKISFFIRMDNKHSYLLFACLNPEADKNLLFTPCVELWNVFIYIRLPYSGSQSLLFKGINELLLLGWLLQATLSCKYWKHVLLEICQCSDVSEAQILWRDEELCCWFTLTAMKMSCWSQSIYMKICGVLLMQGLGQGSLWEVDFDRSAHRPNLVHLLLFLCLVLNVWKKRSNKIVSLLK